MEFKPFDKVMVRDSITELWELTFYNRYNPDNAYAHSTFAGSYCYCKPYNEEEYLAQFKKPEDTYEEQQAKWVADNLVKLGTIVRIVRDAEDNENGWKGCWDSYMDSATGYLGEVVAFLGVEGIQLKLSSKLPYCAYPYFVLKVIKP